MVQQGSFDGAALTARQLQGRTEIPPGVILWDQLASDDAHNREYIDGLGVSAGRLNNVAADQYVRSTVDQAYVRAAIDQAYVTGLNAAAVSARQLLGTTTTDHTNNRTYIDGLGISATRLNNVAADQYVRSTVDQAYVTGLNTTAASSHQLLGTSTSDHTNNRTYIDGLGISAVRLDRDASWKHDPGLNNVAADQYVRSTVDQSYVNSLNTTAPLCVFVIKSTQRSVLQGLSIGLAFIWHVNGTPAADHTNNCAYIDGLGVHRLRVGCDGSCIRAPQK